MKQKTKIPKALLALVLFMLAAQPAAGQGLPNMIVIMTDDQDDLWSLDAMPKTRRLLKRRGVRFVNSFASNPLCTPSRASLLTGQAAHNHGIWTNNNAAGGGYNAFLPRAHNSLGPWLKARGYRTAFIGSKFLNAMNAKHDIPPGWDRWMVRVKPSPGYFDHRVNDDGVIRSYGSDPEDYSTDVYADAAVQFINATSTPFFLVVTTHAPKTSAIPAPRHAGQYAKPLPKVTHFNEHNIRDKAEPVQSLPEPTAADVVDAQEQWRLRQETLLAVDDLVRTVFKTVRDRGLLNNTYIVFTSDNGFSYGAHRWFGKQFPYDQMARVPLIIFGPGIARGEIREQLVTNLDLVATIIEWSGATPGNPIDGKSLVPLLPSGGETAAWRSVVFLEGRFPSFGTDAYHVTAARSHTRMYSEALRDGVTHREFYDLESDRRQNHNIAKTTPEVTLAPWAALVQKFRTCAGAACEP